MPAAGAHSADVRMRALVTGVAGFIGSQLAEALVARGAAVIGLDCFTDYYARDVKESNLARLGETHLAAQAGVRKSWGRDFRTYTINNIEATQALLEALTVRRVERLVYASS